MVTKPSAADSKVVEGSAQGAGEIEGAASALDIESTKRNLQALVAAGIHAQGLLGHDDGNDDESTDESGDESQNGDRQSVDYEEEEVVSGSILDYIGGQYVQNDSSTGHEGSMQTSGEGHQQHIDVGDSHQDLLSRVANNFRALIGHGFTTTAGVEGAGALGDGGATMDDDEAYTLACETLEHNLRYQRMLRKQLAAIDVAQRRNKEQQENIGTLLSIQARASHRRGGRRGRDDRSTQVDPVTNEQKITAANFFVDEDGDRPPENRDMVRKRKHPPLVYRARRWTDAEREALAQGVRQSNRKILSQRLFQQTKDPRSIWEVDGMADRELEMNLAGLDWKYISKQFVPQHKPVECAIQWATQDHPIINKAPWTRKEERRLVEVVEEHGGHDWVTIAKELDTQRTASQCFQVYQRKLNTEMSRSKWTPEEDRVLTEAVMAYGEGDWQAVAACLDNRTGQQVLHRWCKSINPAIRSGRWDRDEDIALLAAVRLYGVGQWTKIAKHVPGRTDVKCRERYMNVLTPDVNNSQWTPAEDERLIEIVSRVGIGKWSYVADMLGSRTDNQCWRHWRSLHKQGRAPDPPEDVDDSGPEEGTVPTFPEWEEERRRRRMRDSLPPSASTDTAEPDGDALLSFAHTQGTGRKRKTTSGIESARKRQWKRATSTNFVPLLASPSERRSPGADSAASRPPRSKRAKSTGSVLLRNSTMDGGDDALTPSSAGDGTPTRMGGRAAWGRMAVDAEPLASPGSSVRRGSSLRRGRVLNWNNILHVGAEAKAAQHADADAHTRPVLPCGGTAQGLQRLVAAMPEVAAAFNAELVGIDDDQSEPSLDSAPMSWLRQRIETLFIWPLMLGTMDARKQH
ncbi:hypothetical protein IW140_003512 [Coemansia sp. RSA 1813]|nr:hypothetical protein EV178_003398 [Coemansia sp. RSA 1646]KAJ1772930.1 hypothetical protein LPJ74_001069 [Coemansia sp. RSA 1843]KAJ2214322.1 hypothetical protein EV179_003102 [Coemansia sp. RSA 487]KAJ2568888.1 hypothetical protein IW140_003512 [Coemansia sp. RSA 1813]